MYLIEVSCLIPSMLAWLSWRMCQGDSTVCAACECGVIIQTSCIVCSHESQQGFVGNERIAAYNPGHSSISSLSQAYLILCTIERSLLNDISPALHMITSACITMCSASPSPTISSRKRRSTIKQPMCMRRRISNSTRCNWPRCAKAKTATLTR